MSQFYKVLKADPLGDPYTPNFQGAKPTQTYWCQLEGVDKDVSIGKQVRDDGQAALFPGQHVYGDLMYAKSQRGTEYWKFKSAKVPEGVTRPADSPAQATAQAATGMPPVQPGAVVGDGVPGWAVPLYNMVEYIYKEMKKMDSDAQPEVVSHTATTEGSAEQLPDVPAKVEQVGGEPLDEETKKTLDDIFTPPETPEDVTPEEPAAEPEPPTKEK